jgi:hypothetical protein
MSVAFLSVPFLGVILLKILDKNLSENFSAEAEIDRTDTSNPVTSFSSWPLDDVAFRSSTIDRWKNTRQDRLWTRKKKLSRCPEGSF